MIFLHFPDSEDYALNRLYYHLFSFFYVVSIYADRLPVVPVNCSPACIIHRRYAFGDSRLAEHADAIAAAAAPKARHSTAKPGVKISMITKMRAIMAQMCQTSMMSSIFVQVNKKILMGEI